MSNEQIKPRFSVAGSGVSDDARKTMNAAIDAFTNWRNEFAQNSERNGNAVFDKMGQAAKAFGWPSEFVDMTRQQMQSASKMQLQFMDQVMDVWEKQLKNPSSAFQMPEAWTDAMKTMQSGASGFPGMPGMPGMMDFTKFPGMPDFTKMPGMNFPGMPGASGFPGMPGMGANPFQFWMQAAEMWQKSWEQGMKAWMDQTNTMSGRK